MKNAYVVASPPSTGNRMMVRAIESTMDFGDGGHKYEREDSFEYISKWISFADKIDPEILDKKLVKAPEQFVYVLSIPHGGPPNHNYPPLADIVSTIARHNYSVFPIVMHRNRNYLLKSLVKQGHVKTEEEGRELLAEAYDFLFSEYADILIDPYVIKYESFVTNSIYRLHVLQELLFLPDTAHMEFFNANKNYG